MVYDQSSLTWCCTVTVAKVRPSRFIRAGSSLKLLAARSAKFYKSPASVSSTSRRRAVFFLRDTSAARCPCLQTNPAVVDHRSPRAGRRDVDDGGVLVAGRLEQVGGRRRRTRLVINSALPLSSESLVRRAVRIARNPDLCRTVETERRGRGPGGRLGRKRPDRLMSDGGRQVEASSGRRGNRKRARPSQDAGRRRSRKRKERRNRKTQRRQQN